MEECRQDGNGRSFGPGRQDGWPTGAMREGFKVTIKIGLLGAGRIGKAHAEAIAAIEDAELAAVFDPVIEAAEAIAEKAGARRASIDDILADPAIDAVIIATPTDLHVEQIEASARAGKGIFCEKPIALDTSRVRSCLDVVARENARLMIGFNRRFDPHIAELRNQIDRGSVGDVELAQITSRDPAPPPEDYVRRSGGIFRDMMIHDFDMARFLLGEEIVEVSATGSVLFDRMIGDAGDVDTATATLKSETGKICVITNSRRATYGYDQRIEVHGSKGLAAVDNVRSTNVLLADGSGYRTEPLLHFFMERYLEAYKRELAAFIDALTRSVPLSPDGKDGLKALEIADAAEESARSSRKVTI